MKSTSATSRLGDAALRVDRRQRDADSNAMPPTLPADKMIEYSVKTFRILRREAAKGDVTAIAIIKEVFA